MSDENDAADIVDAAVRNESEELESGDFVYFSVSPWENFKFGQWVFTKGSLRLTREDAVRFEADIQGLPGPVRTHIKKIDAEASAAMVREHQAASQGIEGTESKAALEKLMTANPRIGTKPIG